MECKHEVYYCRNCVFVCLKCGQVIPAPEKKEEEKKPVKRRAKKGAE